MKRQSFDAKCVSRRNKILKNNKGFSLMELMIATGISAVVSLGVASIFIFTIQQFVILVERNQAQENLLWLAFHTKNIMSQAVELDTNGQITATTTDGSGNMVIAANFLREWGNESTEIRPTLIALQNPTPNQEGVVYFDVNSPLNAAMTPGPEDIFYGKVVQYDLTSPSIIGTQSISTEVSITTRYHKDTDRSTWNWCPPDDTACTPGGSAPYVDSSMNFTVSFRNNNALGKATNGTYNSIHGGIYYFKFIPPRVNF